MNPYDTTGRNYENSTQAIEYNYPVLKRMSYNISEERMKKIYRLINAKLRGEEIKE